MIAKMSKTKGVYVYLVSVNLSVSGGSREQAVWRSRAKCCSLIC